MGGWWWTLTPVMWQLGLSCTTFSRKQRVLCYYSKSLNSAQRNYCTTKKELLAIVATFNHWDVLLSCVSEPFMLHTDHATLTWLRTMDCRDKAMVQRCDGVNKYNFTIQHWLGAKHQNADREPIAPDEVWLD